MDDNRIRITNEAILRLKAEILAPDWQLSPRRAEALATAFTDLGAHFTEHPAGGRILAMADQVLSIIAAAPKTTPPAAMDFLKQAMAHLVVIYENIEYDQEQEEELFRKVARSHQDLMKKLAMRPEEQPTGPTSPAAGRSSAAPRAPRPLETAMNQASTTTKAEAGENEPPPGTLLRRIVIYRKPLAIEEEYVAMVREVAAKKRKAYYKNSHVPIKDFSSLFKSLAGQFKGNLSTIKDSKLKQLTLPVVTPSGIGLPEIPDEGASTLVVACSGRWNGALFCAEAADTPVTLSEFRKGKNGDILGVAVTDSGEELALINIEALLRREGFLSMVY